MNIQKGLSAQAYEALGEQLSKLEPHELLLVLKGLRNGHDIRRQQEEQSPFLGSDRFLGVAMERLGDHLIRRRNGGESNQPQVMA